MGIEKIATCCYCGTRAALVLRGSDRHELACSSCGAPLRHLKMLKAEHPGRKTLVKGHRDAPYARPAKPKYEKPRKRKKRKTIGRKILSEAFDLLDDIFD